MTWAKRHRPHSLSQAHHVMHCICQEWWWWIIWLDSIPFLTFSITLQMNLSFCSFSGRGLLKERKLTWNLGLRIFLDSKSFSVFLNLIKYAEQHVYLNTKSNKYLNFSNKLSKQEQQYFIHQRLISNLSHNKHLNKKKWIKLWPFVGLYKNYLWRKKVISHNQLTLFSIPKISFHDTYAFISPFVSSRILVDLHDLFKDYLLATLYLLPKSLVIVFLNYLFFYSHLL